MLPLLRVLLPGGFLIVTLGVVTGFVAPAGSRAHIVRIVPPASGPLLSQDDHPEWRQFLVLAAARRTQEVESLLDLPGQRPVALPDRTASSPPSNVPTMQTAGLPQGKDDNASDLVTGSADNAVKDGIPIDIGEASSTELPIAPPQTIPALEQPTRLQPAEESGVSVPVEQPSAPPQADVAVDDAKGPAHLAPALPRQRPKIEAMAPARKKKAKPRIAAAATPAETPTSPFANLFGPSPTH